MLLILSVQCSFLHYEHINTLGLIYVFQNTRVLKVDPADNAPITYMNYYICTLCGAGFWLKSSFHLPSWHRRLPQLHLPGIYCDILMLCG